MDSSTASHSRIEYARICVEIKASSSLPEVILLKEDGLLKEIHVEYEWKPSPCKSCNTFGHSETQCIHTGNTAPPIQHTPMVASSTRGQPTLKSHEEWVPVKRVAHTSTHSQTKGSVEDNTIVSQDTGTTIENSSPTKGVENRGDLDSSVEPHAPSIQGAGATSAILPHKQDAQDFDQPQGEPQASFTEAHQHIEEASLIIDNHVPTPQGESKASTESAQKLSNPSREVLERSAKNQKRGKPPKSDAASVSKKTLRSSSLFAQGEEPHS
ncbi:hypothetical protein QJS10_CPB15g00883 [Acorus calamus]|uniref:DUF4283 domain-containing protein n=1 Tax=Acorus calamus TaxID=4465 RepID=A0AAV9D3D9_ACOCL|nr:hypothetical protein QJS10_CPB15g00883 [Acorus calamus]